MKHFIKKYPVTFTGLSITILFILFWLIRLDVFDYPDLKLYDGMNRLKNAPKPSSEIIFVDIDDLSIERLGRWPWPRSIIAEGIRRINDGDPKVIGLNILFSDPEKNSGIETLDNLETFFIDHLLENNQTKGKLFLEAINEARKKLDHDRHLADAIGESGKVVLPVVFREENSFPSKPKTETALLGKHAATNIRSRLTAEVYTAREILMPLPSFIEGAATVGHMNHSPDVDGSVRKERLIYKYGNLYIPSFNLKIAARYLNIPDNEIKVNLGNAIYLDSLKIPTTPLSELLVRYNRSKRMLKSFSYVDVLEQKIPQRIFKNKIVLIGPTASGMSLFLKTPVNRKMTEMEFSAHIIWTILNNRFIHQPPWHDTAILILIAGLGLLMTLVFPRLSSIASGIIVLVVFTLLTAISIRYFILEGIWVRVCYPLSLLFVGYMGIITVKYFTEKTKKTQIDTESPETGKMLGLTFQDKGMLDLAFNKYRNVPVDDEMKEILYNLALGYEKKRQFNKAAMVYRYIEQHDVKFKDVHPRIKKLMQASGRVLSNHTAAKAGASVDHLSNAHGKFPTLGGYNLIKQLDKGSMGIVYLGIAPRNNRKAAVKTFRFSDHTDPNFTAKAKKAFFLETQIARTLSHPNIVDVYNAGENKDIGYVAMEFLEGHDLKRYTKKDNLLPLARVIRYGAEIADALDYVHRKGIFHGDINPASIVLSQKGFVKVTDFGMAKISVAGKIRSDTAQTVTFCISPEQLSDNDIDGRSDIFSLGMLLFQLLTGEFPFKETADSKLRNNILNGRPPDPRKYNPKIVKPLVTVLNKALEKDKNRRYRTASLMAAHLREVSKKLYGIIPVNK